MRLKTGGVLSLCISILVPAGIADAVTRERRVYPNAAAWCQGALPAFSSTLRARPLAIMNEGNAPAFVTCSMPGGGHSLSPQAKVVGLNIINRGNVIRTITCTLVNGIESGAGPIDGTSFVPKSADVPPANSEFVVWVPNELPDAPATITNPNLSCQLPPGTGIAYLMSMYDEDVGE